MIVMLEINGVNFASEANGCKVLKEAEYEVGEAVVTASVEGVEEDGRRVKRRRRKNPTHTFPLLVSGNTKPELSKRISAIENAIAVSRAVVRVQNDSAADIYATFLNHAVEKSRLSVIYKSHNSIFFDLFLETDPYWTVEGRLDNLAKNPYMTVDNNQDGKPDGFSVLDDAAVTKAFLTSKNGSIVRVTGSTGAGNGGWYQEMAIPNATAISFAIELKTLSPSSLNYVIDYVFLDNLGANIGSYTTVASITTATDFTRYKRENISPPAGAVKIRVRAYCAATSASASGTLQARNLILVKSSTVPLSVYDSVFAWGSDASPYALITLPAFFDIDNVGGDVAADLKLVISGLANTGKLVIARKKGDAGMSLVPIIEAENIKSSTYGTVVVDALARGGNAVSFTPTAQNTRYWLLAAKRYADTELVVNNSFETAGGPPQPFANWTKTEFVNGAVTRETTTPVIDGSAWCKLSAPASSEAWITSDYMAITESYNYLLSFYARNLNQWDIEHFDILIEYYNASYGFLGNSHIDLALLLPAGSYESYSSPIPQSTPDQYSIQGTFRGIFSPASWKLFEWTIFDSKTASDVSIIAGAVYAKLKFRLTCAYATWSMGAGLDLVSFKRLIVPNSQTLKGLYYIMPRVRTDGTGNYYQNVSWSVAVAGADGASNLVVSEEKAMEQAAYHNLFLGPLRIPPSPVAENLPVQILVGIKDGNATRVASYVDCITLIPADEAILVRKSSTGAGRIIADSAQKYLSRQYGTGNLNAERLLFGGNPPRLAPGLNRIVIADGGEALTPVSIWFDKKEERFVVPR